MKNHLQVFFTVFSIFIILLVHVVTCCERPLEVRGVEDYCWSKEVEVGERIQRVEKKVVNFAKRKLGMDVDEPSEPQKCNYYYCVFKELKLLNQQYDVPCIGKTTDWVKRNVIYEQALVLLDRIEMCTGELANSTLSGYSFKADNVDKSPEDHVTDSPSEPQSKCEISAEYMKCLSYVEREQQCPIFQYP
ncbi:uncharacterized protein [Leptinotarsa decemlineata]|uniref:uncharacterized protein n=1 Tax=Leptinotarsa decemlineata TaxID=7539 RepID=UPI003D307142